MNKDINKYIGYALLYNQSVNELALNKVSKPYQFFVRIKHKNNVFKLATYFIRQLNKITYE